MIDTYVAVETLDGSFCVVDVTTDERVSDVTCDEVTACVAARMLNEASRTRLAALNMLWEAE